MLILLGIFGVLLLIFGILICRNIKEPSPEENYETDTDITYQKMDN